MARTVLLPAIFPSLAWAGVPSDWTRELNLCVSALDRVSEAAGTKNSAGISRSVSNERVTVSVFAGYSQGKSVFENTASQVIRVLVSDSKGGSHALTLPVNVLDQVRRTFRYTMPDGSMLVVTVRNSEYPSVGFIESAALSDALPNSMSWNQVRSFESRTSKASLNHFESGLGASVASTIEATKNALGYGSVPPFLYESVGNYLAKKKARQLPVDSTGEGPSCFGATSLKTSKDLERLRPLVKLTHEAQARCQTAESWFDGPMGGRNLELNLDALRWLDRCLSRVEGSLAPTGAQDPPARTSPGG